MDITKEKVIIKPWGKEEILIKTDNYVMKRITITQGNRMSLQYHENKEETVYVLSGTLIVWHSEDLYDHDLFTPNATYHVKPNTVHRFGAPDCEDTIIIECSTPQLTDIIRLSDDYGRTE